MESKQVQMGQEGKKDAPVKKEIPPAARRALEEAAERKATAAKSAESKQKEINGRGGLDPARYGDWEKKGIAVDF